MILRSQPRTALPARSYTDGFIRVNGINLHYLDYGGQGPAVVLIHSLSANAHVFEGLVGAGLTDCCRLIVPDMRGRGLTDQPATGYSLEEQAADLTALLDYLELDRVILGGHSFGGLFALYYAAQNPGRVAQVLVLDAAAQLNELTPLLIAPSLKRLGRPYASWEDYFEQARRAPFYHFWDKDMLPFHQADVLQLPGGAVIPRTRLCTVAALAWHLKSQPWPAIIASVRQPVLLVHGPEPYTFGQPVVDAEKVRITAGILARAEVVTVTGNHQTMLYRTGARLIVGAVRKFLGAAYLG